MNCPRCGSINHGKDGVIKGRQRYKCKECHYHYTVEQKFDVKPDEIRRLAFEMYLEGLRLRSTGRILRISYGTVFNGLRSGVKMRNYPGGMERQLLLSNWMRCTLM
jgi:transposase-like protein